VKYHKRVVFPSTSEVYGACTDPEFKEDESFLVVGPIQKERWILLVLQAAPGSRDLRLWYRGHLEFNAVSTIQLDWTAGWIPWM